MQAKKYLFGQLGEKQTKQMTSKHKQVGQLAMQQATTQLKGTYKNDHMVVNNYDPK